MPAITYVTGNTFKFSVAQAACAKLGLQLLQENVSVDEIQAEDPERIILDKGAKIFERLQKPLIITDNSWHIPALKGFPGPYMKSINQWFTAQDFLHLTSPLEDRRIVLTVRLLYLDGSQQKLFTHEVPATLYRELRGQTEMPSESIIGFDSDGGLTIAEVRNQGRDLSGTESSALWPEFADWLQQHESN